MLVVNGSLYLLTHLLCFRDVVFYTECFGLTENDGHENDGPSKLQGMKLQDVKLQDRKLQDMKMTDKNDGRAEVAGEQTEF